GLVAWGETQEESYGLTLELVERALAYLRHRGAELPALAGGDRPEPHLFLARLRGRLSRETRKVLAVDTAQRDLAERADADVLASRRSTPDHMLRIGSRTCVLELERELDAPIAAFEEVV